MTTEHQASRTLVKSPPELWAECSDAAALARHIGEFGEIRITRLEPETSVAWEGEHGSGTVRIEPSGWGTRVTLTAQTRANEVMEEAAIARDGAAESSTVADAPGPPPIESDQVEEETDAEMETTPAEPDPALAIATGPARGRWKRLIGRTRAWFKPGLSELELVEPAEPPAAAPEPALEMTEPEAVDPEPPEPETPEPSEASDDLDPGKILTAALDSLGQAHHRPFSRA